MEQLVFYVITTLFLCIQHVRGDVSLWNIWWNYEGISGPAFWGRLNSDWFMCTKGKNQSPIDIEPNILLFDPSLKHIVINGDSVSGTLINYGFDLTFEINETMKHNTANLSLGPLSYNYRISQIKVHFGRSNGSGSEHSIGGKHFDGEIHIVAYNSDVYANLSQALKAPRGVAIVAAFLQLRSIPNEEFYLISNLSKLVLYKGQRARLKNFRIKSLLPSTDYYMTYEGSLTQPGCQESVTWILLNKPIYVNNDQLEALRNLRQRDINHPQVFMYDNRRPIMPLNRRSIRTNINFPRGCSMEQDMHYKYFPVKLSVEIPVPKYVGSTKHVVKIEICDSSLAKCLSHVKALSHYSNIRAVLAQRSSCWF